MLAVSFHLLTKENYIHIVQNLIITENGVQLHQIMIKMDFGVIAMVSQDKFSESTFVIPRATKLIHTRK